MDTELRLARLQAELDDLRARTAALEAIVACLADGATLDTERLERAAATAAERLAPWPDIGVRRHVAAIVRSFDDGAEPTSV